MDLTLSYAVLAGLFLNGIPAVEFAATDGAPKQLELRDVMMRTDVSAEQARGLMRIIATNLPERRSNTASIAVEFAQLPAQIASQCVEQHAAQDAAVGAPHRSCLSVAVQRDPHDRLLDARWQPDTLATVRRWLAHMTLYRPETQLVLADCDNTVWAGDIADTVVAVAVEEAMISWSKAPEHPRYPRLATHATPLAYYEYLYGIDPVLAYNYAAEAFHGLTLREAHRAFQRARVRQVLPQAYTELRVMLQTLMDRGVTVGFVSASPLFMVIPMLEHAGYRVPLGAIEGIDIYVHPPGTPAAPLVTLSSLIQTNSTVHAWTDVLAAYGDYRIAHVSELVTAQKGKAVAGRAIADRHVLRWNQAHPTRRIAPNQMILAGVLGDNFGPFNDRPGAAPQAVGNDQGLVMALNQYPAHGMLLLNIYRAIGNAHDVDLQAKRAYYERFLAFVDQIETNAYPIIPVEQVAIYSGTRLGFVPVTVPRQHAARSGSLE